MKSFFFFYCNIISKLPILFLFATTSLLYLTAAVVQLHCFYKVSRASCNMNFYYLLVENRTSERNGENMQLRRINLNWNSIKGGDEQQDFTIWEWQVEKKRREIRKLKSTDRCVKWKQIKQEHN